MKDALGDVQSVLVLGGGSDIALATLQQLVSRGRLRTVILAGRNPDTMAGARDQLVAKGVTVDVVAFDADATDTHQAVIDDVAARHGDLDLVILAFARLGDQKEFQAHPAQAAAVAHTNFVGAVCVGLIVANRLGLQGHGTLVVLSSVAGERARADNFVYGATKAGLDAFAQGLGDSLVGSGARVLVVRPGFVRTKMTTGLAEAPLTTGPEAVAKATLRGLASGAHTVWSPPALRYVFIGMRHAPRGIWRKLAR